MKNISTGAGLVVLGLGIALHPIVSGLVAQATAAPSSSSASAAAAVASAATAQAGPTVVWYGVGIDENSLYSYRFDRLYRALSDGTVEMKRVLFEPNSGSNACNAAFLCASPWIVISSPNQGFKSAADINADELVDGADLASVLSNWGDAPRVPFPPSDCPLNLINP
jgi:hypothetical protein